MSNNNGTQLYTVTLWRLDTGIKSSVRIFASDEDDAREQYKNSEYEDGWTIESVTLYDRAHDTTTTDAGAAT